MISNPTYCFAAAEEPLHAACPQTDLWTESGLYSVVYSSPAHTLSQLNLPFDPPALVQQQPPIWEGFSPTSFDFPLVNSGPVMGIKPQQNVALALTEDELYELDNVVSDLDMMDLPGGIKAMPSPVTPQLPYTVAMKNEDFFMGCTDCGGCKDPHTGGCYSLACQNRSLAASSQLFVPAPMLVPPAPTGRPPVRNESTVFSCDEPTMTSPGPKKEQPAAKKKQPRAAVNKEKRASPAAAPRTSIGPPVTVAAAETLPAITGDPARDAFLANVYYSHAARGTSIVKLPVVGKIPLNLFALHKAVSDHGGFEKVVKEKQWKPIAINLGISLKACTDYGFRLRCHYERFLKGLDAEGKSIASEAAAVGAKRAAPAASATPAGKGCPKRLKAGSAPLNSVHNAQKCTR